MGDSLRTYILSNTVVQARYCFGADLTEWMDKGFMP